MHKILLVEDDQFLFEIYATKFKEAGFEVEGAENGFEALDKLNDTKPDLILLDIVMPKMDGFEFLRRIKEENKFKDIPVVFLTNLGQKEEVDRGLALGAVDYVVKAYFTPTEVVNKVKEILQTKYSTNIR